MDSSADDTWLRRGRHAAPAGPARRAWTDLLRLVLPVSCPGCGRPDVPLCRRCRNTLPRNAFRVTSLLAQDAPPTWACGDYTGVVQRLVLAYKDDPPGGRPDLQHVLASCLARAALGALSESEAPDDVHVLLVPVPSTRATVRRRGGDLTAGLARAAASRLRRSGRDVVVLPAVRRRRAAGHQAGLSAAQRSRNLDGALVLRPGPALVGRAVLVLDDVVTTGASLQACSQVLLEAGAHVLGAATVASTPLRHGRHADREADGRGGLLAPPGKD